MAPVFGHVIVEELIGQTGVAGGQRDDDGLGVFDRRGDALPALERFHHRCAAAGLDETEGGQFIDQPKGFHLAEAFAHADGSHAAADALEIPVRRTPTPAVFQLVAKLFGDFVGHRFHGFNGGHALDAPVEEDALGVGEAGCERLRLVVGAGRLDDLRAVERRLTHFVVGGPLRKERPQLDSGTRPIGGIGDGDVARAGHHHFVDPHLAQGRQGDGGLPVFETPGRPLALIFDVEVTQAEVGRQHLGLQQWCGPFAHADDVGRVVDGQDFVIAPQRFLAST